MKLLLVILLLARMVATGDPRAFVPRDPYMLDGYVPIGFSGFGTWTARKKTTLYAAAGSRKVAATIAKCAEVAAQNGQLRGHPWEMRVMKDHPPFRAGDRLWILARDLEEGYFQLWYRGELRDDLAGELQDAPPFSCSKASPKCWLSVGKQPRQEHWVSIRKNDGTLGWSNRASDFAEGSAKDFQCP